jgi:hypothetical protein
MPKNTWQKIARDMDRRKVNTQQKMMKTNFFLGSLMKKVFSWEQDVY